MLDCKKSKKFCSGYEILCDMIFLYNQPLLRPAAMIGISTAWQSDRVNNGERLLAELEKTGLFGIELEYRVTRKMFLEMKPLLQKGPFTVQSIHNFFPLPDILPKSEASGDAFKFSSGDKDERKNGVKYTLKTLETANELEVGAVVLHLGNVPIKTDVRKLFELYNSKKLGEEEGQEFIETIKNERREKRQRPFDNVLSAMDRLLREAERLNVTLCIENRYFPHEIPDFEEIGIILKEFEGGKIAYWHDVGHASVQELMGFEEKNRLIKTYSDRIAGIHLHGAFGYNDHLAPNSNIDFLHLAKYLKPDTIKIVETHYKVPLEELKEGIDYLRSNGID